MARNYCCRVGWWVGEWVAETVHEERDRHPVLGVLVVASRGLSFRSQMVFSPFVDGTPLPALSDSLGTKRAPSCEPLCVKERRVIAHAISSKKWLRARRARARVNAVDC